MRGSLCPLPVARPQQLGRKERGLESTGQLLPCCVLTPGALAGLRASARGAQCVPGRGLGVALQVQPLTARSSQCSRARGGAWCLGDLCPWRPRAPAEKLARRGTSQKRGGWRLLGPGGSRPPVLGADGPLVPGTHPLVSGCRERGAGSRGRPTDPARHLAPTAFPAFRTRTGSLGSLPWAPEEALRKAGWSRVEPAHL